MKSPNKPISKKLKTLIDDCNEAIKSIDEFLEDESSGMAEFCSSIGYGDSELELDRINDDAKELIERLKSHRSDKKLIKEIIVEACSLEFTHGYHRRSNEVYSCQLGECEETLPDDLSARIDKLKEWEYCILRAHLDAFLPERRSKGQTLVYINRDYDRWSMILDVDKLADELDRLGIPKEIAPVLDTRTPIQRRAEFRLLNGGAA